MKLFRECLTNVFKCVLPDGKLFFLKKDTEDEGNKTIIVVLITYMNFIDSVLPILFCLRNRNVRIVSVLDCDEAIDYIRTETALISMLEECSDTIIVMDGIGRKRDGFFAELYAKIDRLKRRVKFEKGLLGYMKKFNVKSVLFEAGNISNINKELRHYFPNARFISGEHGAFTGIEGGNIERVKQAADGFRYSEIHMCTDAMKYKEYLTAYKDLPTKFILVGIPRFDKWWMDKVFQLSKISMQSLQNTIQDKVEDGKKVVAVLWQQFKMIEPISEIEGVDQRGFCASELEGLTRFFDKYSNRCFFLFKFHPTQVKNEHLIQELLRKVCPSFCADIGVISNLPCILLSQLADFTISIGSTTAEGDALVSGKPVVDFYKSRNTGWFYKDYDGTYGNYAKLHNLAIHTESGEELSDAVNMLINDEEFMWDEYYNRTKECLILDNKRSMKAANLILDCVL